MSPTQPKTNLLPRIPPEKPTGGTASGNCWKVTEEAVRGLSTACDLFEHYIQGPKWLFLGKEFPETDLFAMIIRNDAKTAQYLGILDRRTAALFMERLESGMNIDGLLAFYA